MFKHLNATFEEFLANIALTSSQAKSIDKALVSLSELFLSEFRDVEIYVQGSFATGTTVKPLTENQSAGNAGEYDVDIVLERSAWQGAKDALEEVERCLEDDAIYGGMLARIEKESCARVEYASDQATGVNMHVDLVPIKRSHGRHVALRSRDEWKPSDPTTVIDWFNQVKEGNPYIPAHILFIKRIRDVAGLTLTFPSILIMAFVTKHFSSQDSYADELVGIIEGMHHDFQADYSNAVVKLPVLDENLIDKLSEADYLAIRRLLAGLKDTIPSVLANPTTNALYEIFSDDFPAQIVPEEVQALRAKNWHLALDGTLKRIRPTARSTYAISSPLRKGWIKFTRRHEVIEFTGDEVNANEMVTTRWQVLNALGSENRRGLLEEPKRVLAGGRRGTAKNIFSNEETELYDGLHWIRYFVVTPRTGTVIQYGYKHEVMVDPSSPQG